MRKINAIVIPGLGGRYNLYEKAVRYWAIHGISTTVFHINWEDQVGYEPKAENLNRLIKEKLKSDEPLILVGVSAGASAAINAFAEHKDIAGVVTVCGFTNIEYLDQKVMNKRSPAFVESMVKLSANLDRFTIQDKKKLLPYTAYADMTVSDDASELLAIPARRIFATGHVVGIAVFLLFYSSSIRRNFAGYT